MKQKMNGINEVLKCPKCGLHAVELKPVILFVLGKSNIKVCKPCRKYFKQYGKFTRDRVSHDYPIKEGVLNG